MLSTKPIKREKDGSKIEHVRIELDRGISFESALKRHEEARNDNRNAAFYRHVRQLLGGLTPWAQVFEASSWVPSWIHNCNAGNMYLERCCALL